VTEQEISKFFDERKEIWMKKNQKSSMSDDEVLRLKEECEELFKLEKWLPDAAKRAGQISMSTHPCTFSHPSSRKNKNGYVSPIIANVQKQNDGFLRSGNVEVQSDALGNAAALDVYKFLNLIMNDGKKLIYHIEKNSEISKSLLNIKDHTYEQLRNGFLKMINSSQDLITSEKIKQVYFPVYDDYHQLSVLSNSGIIYNIKERINSMRFSDEVKEKRAKRKKEEYSESGYSEIFELTSIGYGGTKPQNISVLNSQNGGKAYLLRSMPPVLKKREIYFPKSNFFIDSLRVWEVSKIFKSLYSLSNKNYERFKWRNEIINELEKLMDIIIEKMWAVRSVSLDQYYEKNSKLKSHQKIWLLHLHEKERDSEDDWLDKLEKEISRWIIKSYENYVKKENFKLGKGEYKEISNEIVHKYREDLR